MPKNTGRGSRAAASRTTSKFYEAKARGGAFGKRSSTTLAGWLIPLGLFVVVAYFWPVGR